MYPDTFTIGPLAAFLAGIISVLSPCVLPLLPVIFAYSTTEGKFRPLAIVLGLILTFTLMGIAVSSLGAAIQPFIDDLRIVAELLIIVFGIAMLTDIEMFSIVNKYTGNIHVEKKGIFGGLLLGSALGIVWIPCVGPILGAILTIVALEASIVYGATLLFIYSLGFAAPMLIIAYSTKFSSEKLRTISRYDIDLKKIAGIVLIITGLWMIYSNHISGYL
ncbi:cytochrome c biogenesis CcdA family protein [Methanolobus sp. ZRKC3]|uniref:cytochrome c biogenesis CcdA family protein n=1 Tax=Methanolobus sp. ZRKC3 TaxID=3125786 RepID=UPI0032453601